MKCPFFLQLVKNIFDFPYLLNLPKYSPMLIIYKCDHKTYHNHREQQLALQIVV